MDKKLSAEHELGRYKDKVKRQQAEIDRLKQEIETYKEAVNISYAMVTAAIKHTGAVTIAQDELNGILKSGVFAAGTYDAETMTYTMEVYEDGAEK